MLFLGIMINENGQRFLDEGKILELHTRNMEEGFGTTKPFCLQIFDKGF